MKNKILSLIALCFMTVVMVNAQEKIDTSLYVLGKINIDDCKKDYVINKLRYNHDFSSYSGDRDEIDLQGKVMGNDCGVLIYTNNKKKVWAVTFVFPICSKVWDGYSKSDAIYVFNQLYDNLTNSGKYHSGVLNHRLESTDVDWDSLYYNEGKFSISALFYIRKGYLFDINKGIIISIQPVGVNRFGEIKAKNFQVRLSYINDNHQEVYDDL